MPNLRGFYDPAKARKSAHQPAVSRPDLVAERNLAIQQASESNRYICDGHEYRAIDASHPGFNITNILNNYGTHVATLWRSVDMDHWRVRAETIGAAIGDIHEDDIADNLLDQWAVQCYVAWAIDRGTVENH